MSCVYFTTGYPLSEYCYHHHHHHCKIDRHYILSFSLVELYLTSRGTPPGEISKATFLCTPFISIWHWSWRVIKLWRVCSFSVPIWAMPWGRKEMNKFCHCRNLLVCVWWEINPYSVIDRWWYMYQHMDRGINIPQGRPFSLTQQLRVWSCHRIHPFEDSSRRDH